jgi:hypothetical protein
MKNKELISLIIRKIDNKFPYILSHLVIIDTESLSMIEKIEDDYYLSSDKWEVNLKDLTNRELWEIYKIIKKNK